MYVQIPLSTNLPVASSSMRARDKCSVSTISSIGEAETERPRVVKLIKSDNGYGFFLKQMKNSPMHVICDIEKGSVAEGVGLHNGDILGCVNGEDVMRTSHVECVKKIRLSGESVELTVASYGVMKMFYQHGITASSADQDSWLCLDDSTFSYTNLAYEGTPQIETNFSTVFHSHSASTSSLDATNKDLPSKDPTKDFTLPASPLRLLSTSTTKSSDSLLQSPTSSSPLPRLHKLTKEDQGYGFFLDHDLETDYHKITKVEPNSAADKAGLRDGDRLLEVNETSVAGKTHQDVLDIIMSQDDQLSLLVICDEASWKNMEIKSKAKEEFYRRISSYSDSVHECCLIKKPDEEFEFFLMVDTARNSQVITEIKPGGPADRCGLKNGDMLIEVNGINVENKPHGDVVNIIKTNVIENQIRFLVSGEKRSLYQEKRKDSCVIS